MKDGEGDWWELNERRARSLRGERSGASTGSAIRVATVQRRRALRGESAGASTCLAAPHRGAALSVGTVRPRVCCLRAPGQEGADG